MSSYAMDVPLSSKAVGKARATDVGIRSRLAAVQEAREQFALAPHDSQYRRSMAPFNDLRPNIVREAWDAHLMQSLTQPVPKPHVRGRPTVSELQHGNLYVNWIRKDVLSRAVQLLKEKHIPEEQVPAYRDTFDVLWGHVFEMDPLLPRFACWMTEANINQLILITTLVKHQKRYLSSDNPRYFLDLKGVLHFLHAVQTAQRNINAALQGTLRAGSTGTSSSAPPSNGQSPMGSSMPMEASGVVASGTIA